MSEITLNSLPKTLDELKAMPQAALTVPEEVAALTVAALALYPESPAEAEKMLDFLRGPRPGHAFFGKAAVDEIVILADIHIQVQKIRYLRFRQALHRLLNFPDGVDVFMPFRGQPVLAFQKTHIFHQGQAHIFDGILNGIVVHCFFRCHNPGKNQAEALVIANTASDIGFRNRIGQRLVEVTVFVRLHFKFKCFVILFRHFLYLLPQSL